MLKKVIIGLSVIFLLCLSGFWFWPRSGMANLLRLPGTVEIQDVRFGSRIAGRVSSIQIQESQIVNTGQTLFTLEPFEWSAKREQARQKAMNFKSALDKANAGPLPEEIAEAKAAMDGAKARYDRAKAGYREEQKRQAKADLEAAQADQWKAEEELTRLTKANNGAVSKTEMDAATAAREATRGRVRSLTALLDMFIAGNRKEDIDEAKADYEKSMSHYQFLQHGTRNEDKAIAYALAKQAEAELDETEVNFRETTVTAPEKCVIEVISIRPGDLVTAGQPVIRALRADDLWVKVFVPATELGKLRLGQSADVTVDSHPGRKFKGKIISIASISEFTPRNVQSLDERKHQVFAVKVHVADPDGIFKSGMAAVVEVPVEAQ